MPGRQLNGTERPAASAKRGRSQSPHSTETVWCTDRETMGQQNPSEGRPGRKVETRRSCSAKKHRKVPNRLSKVQKPRLQRHWAELKPKRGRTICCRRWSTAFKAAKWYCLLREGRTVRALCSPAHRETASMKKPPTGEPYAGKPPVRFGGRSRRKPIPTPISVCVCGDF